MKHWLVLLSEPWLAALQWYNNKYGIVHECGGAYSTGSHPWIS